MDVDMVVNRASTGEVPMIVAIGGVQQEIRVIQLEVELIDPTNTHGTWLLRIRGSKEDREEAAAKYVEGSTITISLP